MKVVVRDNRVMQLSESGQTRYENNTAILKFVFPKEYDSYNKKIAFILPNGDKKWDFIENDEYKIPRAVSKYSEAQFYVWLTKGDNDFRSKTETISFNENDNVDGQITPEEIGAITKILKILEEEIEKVTELEKDLKILMEDVANQLTQLEKEMTEFAEAESIRKTNEETRVTNENDRTTAERDREHNETVRESEEDKRRISEQSRTIAEQQRQTAESTRKEYINQLKKDVEDGKFDGKDGKDGYTPIKGKDYFDGKDGYTPQKGIDYFDGKDGKSGVYIGENPSEEDDVWIDPTGEPDTFRATEVIFADGKDLQKKYDDGELGGGGTDIGLFIENNMICMEVEE